MSLTNPKTVVTEERLSEFYQQILPYLGGMPEMLANKFSKSDLYSTDEKMIGQWIDGKPLYQKTVNCEGVVHGEWISANHNISNIEMVCAVTGGVINPDTRSINGPGVWGDNKQGLSVRADKTTVGGYLYYPSAPNTWLLYVTFQYTKTTDSAISIGTDTDYSTDEKIIGTWIDGKPIYQKTFSGSLTNSSYTDMTGDFTNIDKVVNVNGFIYPQNLSTESPMQIGAHLNSNYFSGLYGKNQLWYSNSYKNGTYLVTLQYTKTTD